MIQIRKADARGHFDHGWLNTYHTFSFADYLDPAHMGFRSMRVMNEDFVAAGHGFPMHFHRDMEIVTYVLEGALEHRDSMDNGEQVRPGELQRMTAGTGVQHSEFNSSNREAVHLYQIWLLPERKGLTPGYEQKTFTPEEKRGQWRLVAARDGRDGALTIHQDAALYLADLSAGQRLTYELQPGRAAWLQVLRGTVEVNGLPLATSDGAAVSEETCFRVAAASDAELMLFDLG